jgi:hypothetical protein
MADIVGQHTFSKGELSPNLYARVDLAAYKDAVALAQNWLVDYRGGLSTRMGTKLVLRCKSSTQPVRLIRFQVSTYVGYILEFGQEYIRFHFQGSPVVEAPFAITGVSQANPAVVTAPGHNYSAGDWIYITGVGGMTELDGRYFIIAGITGNNLRLHDTNNVPVNSTTFPAYTSGGQTQRVYTLTTPYQASDLALLKFTQITTEMILTHASYAPYTLSIITATNWVLAAITFGSTASPPTNVTVTTTLPNGTAAYTYYVTSIDTSGQESTPSAAGVLTNSDDIRLTSGTNQITWTPSPTAVAYNVYEVLINYFDITVPGVPAGFIGTCTENTFVDSNIAQDFSETPPVAQNPFVGDGISFLTITAPGTYTTVPTISFSGGSPSIPATAYASLGATALPTITAGGANFTVNDTVGFGNGLILRVAGVTTGAITSWTLVSPGSITSGSVPANPINQVSTSGTGTGAEATVTWGVLAAYVQTQGAGYGSTPTPVFSSGAAAATATLTATSNGNPSVCSFFQQRLVLAAPSGAPQTFYMSQPGGYFNFNVTAPVQADNSITETLVGNVQERIVSIVSSTSGMLVLTDQNTYLVNGGSSGAGVSPTAIVASRQSAVGANDMPPIAANYDILFVDSKGFSVRDLAYNIYFNIFTGSDITVNSSHLFFGYTLLEWAYAEAPFYNVWTIRSDGVMLTLTFLKEQEFIGWTHSTTQGKFLSVASVTETTTDSGNVDAVYVVTSRTVNGSTAQLVERIADRAFPNGLSSAWCVDCGLQYSGAGALSFIGGESLAGATVTGLAMDNLGAVYAITSNTQSLGTIQAIAPFVMPETGFFSLPSPTNGASGYTLVTVGIGFDCDLQTLAIDVGQPPIQGKLKQIPYVDVRVNQALGLKIGSSFQSLVAMKDLVDGAINSMQTGLQQPAQQVNGLFSGDARTRLDASYNVFGQYCIRQDNPFPATVLGVFPALTLGDSV